MTPGAGADDGTVTWRRLWAETTELLEDRAEARWLCETAGSFDGDELLGALDEPATERMVAHLDAMVARYRAGEPLQYVLGHWAFRRLDVMVDRRVLIPRPETELVAGVALDEARRLLRERAEVSGGDAHVTVADLGTGSGVIGLSIADEMPIGSTTVWLTDASEDALDVARANAAGLGRAASVVRVARGTWFDALPAELRGGLDVVVSNPPYIAVGDPEIEASVHEWEPHQALYAGGDGLHDIRTIVAGAAEWLAPGGAVVLEIGRSLGGALRELLVGAGFVGVEIRPDLTGHDRIALARRP